MAEKAETEPRQQPRWRFFCGCFLIILILGTGVMLLFWSSFTDFSFQHRAFSATEWSQGDLRQRGEMVKALREQKILEGRTYEEVLKLLGPPDKEFKGAILRYHVDIGRRIVWKVFPVILVINMDRDNRVYEVHQVD